MSTTWRCTTCGGSWDIGPAWYVHSPGLVCPVCTWAPEGLQSGELVRVFPEHIRGVVVGFEQVMEGGPFTQRRYVCLMPLNLRSLDAVAQDRILTLLPFERHQRAALVFALGWPRSTKTPAELERLDPLCLGKDLT